jgi:hypothetical protein
MASILHVAQNMEEELPLSVDQAPNPPALAPPIHAFVAVGRNSSGGRYNARGGRDGHGPLPSKCSGCGGLDHIMSSCTSSSDAMLKWTLAKRKIIVLQYGAPTGQASHNALLSDMHQSDTNGDAPGAGPSEMECTDEYDHTEVGTTFCDIAFSASTPRDVTFTHWVVHSACSINLNAFRSDFVIFDPPSGTSRVGGVSVDVLGSGNVEIAIPLVSGQIRRRKVHALYTHDLSARFAQRIGRPLSVSWMQSHSGCEFLLPTDTYVGLLLAPKGMGVLKPSGNGLYLLQHSTATGGLPSIDRKPVIDSEVALTT